MTDEGEGAVCRRAVKNGLKKRGGGGGGVGGGGCFFFQAEDGIRDRDG